MGKKWVKTFFFLHGYFQVPWTVDLCPSLSCDVSKLAASDVEKYFCFSERVCYDTANRLIYEGVDKSMITIADTEDVETIFKEIDSVETDNIYLITWIKTFYHMKKYIEKELSQKPWQL